MSGIAVGAALLPWLAIAATARAEGPDQPPAAPLAQASPPTQATASDQDDDLDSVPAEPDFNVINLPTNLRLPKHKLGFRITHRFARNLGDGSFADLAADLFGFDGGAQIGIGLHYGVFRGNQVQLYRTSDRTIQLADQQELLRQGKSPIGLSVLASLEGLQNFGLSSGETDHGDIPGHVHPEETPPTTLHEFSPSVALVLSRRLGTKGALYAAPSWVGNTRIVPSAPGQESHTLVLGLGARLQVTRTMALVAEAHPRLAGYKGNLGAGDPDSPLSFGVEARVGGHAFQLNFSNLIGTTPAQLARGAQGAQGWFIGFNLTRKFY